MDISDRDGLPAQPSMGMQEIIRMFNEEYSKIIGFTINSDYSQNEIYQTCALMHSIVKRYGDQNYTLNRYLNELKYYLMYSTKPCSNIDEYDAVMTLTMSDDLNDGMPL
jgi:hypothetical protein